VKNVPEVYIRGQGGLLDIVLHPDYAKMVGFTHHASTEGGGEGGNTKLIRAKLKNESLVQIESYMQEINQDSILVPELYLTMKVICTSQQENVAQSLSIHKTSLVTTGKFTASMRMEEFLQTILCR
jgi:hypothetical protein